MASAEWLQQSNNSVLLCTETDSADMCLILSDVDGSD